MKALNIVETAYRATIEEQDDTIVWLTHAMKGAGAEIDVLLRGNAVNYGIKGQDASGLSFGAKKQTHPPDLAGDLERLMGKGSSVYLVEEDLAERGIDASELISGIKTVRKDGLASLLNGYDQIWHW
jgi:sulfur relay (sulfurtransferase) DsrF/TusC family protein